MARLSAPLLAAAAPDRVPSGSPFYAALAIAAHVLFFAAAAGVVVCPLLMLRASAPRRRRLLLAWLVCLLAAALLGAVLSGRLRLDWPPG